MVRARDTCELLFQLIDFGAKDEPGAVQHRLDPPVDRLAKPPILGLEVDEFHAASRYGRQARHLERAGAIIGGAVSALPGLRSSETSRLPSSTPH